MKGPAFQTELATAYPECRLVVTKETLTVEGMIKIVYDLLKDKLNIAKITLPTTRSTAAPRAALRSTNPAFAPSAATARADPVTNVARQATP